MANLKLVCLIVTLINSISCSMKNRDPRAGMDEEVSAGSVEYNFTNLIDHFPPEPVPDKSTYQ